MPQDRHPGHELDLNRRDMSRIAEEITRVTSFEFPDAVQQLLHVLHQERMIRVATLWKIKRRSKSLCAKARTTNVFNPDPKQERFATAFVCPYGGSVLKEIIENKSFRAGEPHEIPDVNIYKEDPFFGPALSTGQVELKKAIILPVVSHKRPKELNPSYILVIYVELGFEEMNIDRSLLQAISNKAGSTLSSQIEIRMNDITNFTKNTAPLTSLPLFLTQFMGKVIPKYFMFRKSILLWRSPSSSRYEIAHDSDELVQLTREMIDATSRACIDQFEREPGTTILFQTCALAKCAPVFSNARSIIVAPIRNSSFSDKPHGFLLLVDKLNPLARQINREAEIVDYFDWEDELLITHAVSMIGMVAELMHAEDRRKQLADQIAHEMVMPANFIIGTAERILDNIQVSVPMTGKDKRQLQDILTYAQLQMALCDGILIGLQEESSPPSRRYNPEQLDLTELVRDVVKLTYPFCRQHRAKFDNITISRHLPRLFVDRSAFTQVFLNLLTNAIKYKGEVPFDEFAVYIDVDDINASKLDPEVIRRHPFRTKFSDRTDNQLVEGGYILTIEDYGMGVPEGFEDRIFTRHFRVPGVEEFAARGSGLGLAIVRRIVADHGGLIWLENRKEPTTFAIYLPRRLARREYVNDRAWRGE